MKLSAEQLEVIEKMEDGENLFITGNAGTGKSTLLKYFLKHTKQKVVVLAPTGVAAMNVGGSTIHSFFKFGFGFQGLATVRKLRDAKGLRSLNTIVIDEISMVRADIFDMIDKTLRASTGVREPFGGVQIILMGDIFQLPPVVRNEEVELFKEGYGGYYFFNAPCFKKGDFSTINLETIFRQKDRNFIDILQGIRSKNLTMQHFNLLNTRTSSILPGIHDDTIVLTTTNAAADSINLRNLTQLRSKEVTYKGKVTGLFRENDLPTPANLQLKIGSRVMFVKNDQSDEKEWVNGTLGEIIDLTSTSIKVKTNQGVVLVTQDLWEEKKYSYNDSKNEWEQETIGSYAQFPLKLAWAITIHKSQGQTFERMYIDLGSRAFAHGQTYVALSRCKTLEGITLKRPLRYEDIIIDQEVLSFTSKSQSEVDIELF
jgi:ATP-dependent DNA helicase PIF1